MGLGRQRGKERNQDFLGFLQPISCLHADFTYAILGSSTTPSQGNAVSKAEETIVYLQEIVYGHF